MFNLNVEKIGKVVVVYCEGRLVRSDAAFRLRDAVTQQRDVALSCSTSPVWRHWKRVVWACCYFCKCGLVTMAFNSRCLIPLPVCDRA
jgi:hypothetical protein